MSDVKLSLIGSKEYCCEVVKIDNINPLPNSDFLAIVEIDGLPIVVRKDEVKIGDIMLYANHETQLSPIFLKMNSLYDFSHREMNQNWDGVGGIKDLPVEEQKKYVGFFAPNGRVKTIKLRGTQSFGFLFHPVLLEYAYSLPQVHWEDYVGQCFDTVSWNGLEVTFIKVYMPNLPQGKDNRNKTKGAQKKVNKIDRVIPGEFAFHYDTQPLAKSMDALKPDKIYTISTKMHGTSFIFANVKCNIPLDLPFYKKIWNAITPKRFNTKRSYVGYGELYASRTVLKNRWVDMSKKSFYEKDVYGYMAELLHGKIPENVTIYGEIVGYLPGSSTFVQKDYDYGCRPGECKLMIYRVVEEVMDKHVEFNPDRVVDFTNDLVCKYPELGNYILSLPILYRGKLTDLYPNVDVSFHWRENIIQAMANDKKLLGMEKDEPMCKNKVPREGVVLRVEDDLIPEAFKLKCIKFLTRESKQIDKGDVDIELAQGKY